MKRCGVERPAQEVFGEVGMWVGHELDLRLQMEGAANKHLRIWVSRTSRDRVAAHALFYFRLNSSEI